MSKYNLLDIHEGKSFEDSQEKSREENHPEKKTIDKIRALMAKEKKVDENEAVDLAIEASQEKAGIEVDESFKSLAKKLDKQKGIDKDEAAKIAGSIAAKKAAGAGKGPTAKQKKRMKEASDTFNIDKVASPDAKAHDYGDEIKGISDEDDTEEAYAHQTVLPLEEIDPTLDPYEDRDEIIKQVMSLLIKEKGASKEELKGFIETHIEDILNAKDDDDVVDEFAQYLSVNEGDRELREHFGRFMKDYQ